MENQSPVNENYLCSGPPVLVARIGVQALDISTGTLYEQARNPSGATYRVIATKYYQPLPVEPQPLSTGTFILDFGEGETTTTVTVTNSGVQSGSKFAFAPASRNEDFNLELINLSVLSISQGQSFVVMAYAPYGTHSTYSINYTIL